MAGEVLPPKADILGQTRLTRMPEQRVFGRAQVPFAGVTQLVARFFQTPRQQSRAIAQFMQRGLKILSIAGHAVVVRILPGDDRCPRRRANRASRVGIFKTCAFPGESVDMWCLARARAISPNSGKTMLIGQNQQDIGVLA